MSKSQIKKQNINEFETYNSFNTKFSSLSIIGIFFLVLFFIIQSIWITKNYLPANINNFQDQNFIFLKTIFSTILKYPLKGFFIIFPFLGVSIIEICRSTNRQAKISIKNTSFYKLKKSHGWKFADIWYFFFSIIQGKISFIALFGTLGIAHYYNAYGDFLNQFFNQFLPFDFINNNLLFFFIISILLGDFVSYLSHRISHKFFGNYMNFTIQQEMTMFSFYRNGLLETFTVEAPILPFRILSVILVSKGLSQGNWSIYTLYIIYNIILQMFIHLGHGSTKIIFPKPISYIFLSPGLHWLHHSNNPNHFESNFGTIFPFGI